MKKINQILHRFQTKVTLTLILSMVSVLALSNLLICKFSLDSQFESLRDKLKIIAQTTSLMIDGEMLLQIPLNHEGVNTPQYQMILEKLIKIKVANPQIKYIYTMTKTNQEGIWQFIVDADPVLIKENRKETAFPGDWYNAGRFPEMLKSFDGPAADTKLEVDEWGVTLSGYAPILDKEGKVVAMIGVDILADDVYKIQREVQHRAILVLGLGLVLSLLLGMYASKRMASPVDKLVEATRRIAKGDLKYQVQIQGYDEISELGRAFNHMAISLHRSRKRILGYLFSVVKTLVKILELRDFYTKGHSQAVSNYAGRIATKMGFPKETVKLFKRMTLLHDIGKLGIKDTILNKQGSLTQEEWEIMKKHPIIGEEILKPVLGEEEMLSIVRGHHERYDGTGYPDRLSQDKINIFASIVSVADAYHAMTSHRSYRSALSREHAIEELKKNSGTQFNPKIVQIFLDILDEERKQ